MGRLQRSGDVIFMQQVGSSLIRGVSTDIVLSKLEVFKKPRTGLVLGTGWSNPAVLKAQGFVCERELSFGEFNIGCTSGSGHPNVFRFGRWNEKDVVISCGRIHRFQDYGNVGHDSLIRQWMSLLILFMNGSNRLVLTSAVGGLSSGMREDMLIMPNGIVSAHHTMPFLIGSDSEFVMSEHLLMVGGLRRDVFMEALEKSGCFGKIQGTHIVVPGPAFGGATERKLWASWGCDTVGMSIDPELRLVAVENKDNHPLDIEGVFASTDIRVFPTLFVSDNHDLPDNNEIQARARAMAPKLGVFLSHVVQSKW